ncbi:MAG: DNA-directed RNA polymerase subunit M [Sulfolobaceae archaeon]
MKKEARVGVIIKANKLYGICIFRGKFLEHLFLGYSAEDVLKKLEDSRVIEEIRYSNFNVGNSFVDEANNEKIVMCRRIIETIDKKLNI